MISLERRMLVSSTVVLLVVFTLLFLAAGTAVRVLGETYVLTRLEHDAEALLSALRRTPRGQWRLREGRITPIYQQPLSGHYYLINIADGSRLRSRSSWDADLLMRAQPVGEVAVYRAPGPTGQRLLFRAAGYRKGGMAFTLVVAEDLAPMHRQITEFQWIAIGVLLLAMLLLVVLLLYQIRRGFRSFDDVRDEIGRVANGELDQLRNLGPAEIRPLTAEVNHLLSQTHMRLRRSRQALGNLAHALKAPLSVLTREVDALPISPERRRDLGMQLDRIDALMARELKRARFSGDGRAQRFNPAEQIPDLVDALRQIHRDRAIDIRVDPLPASMLPFDREDMLELLGNLLDNGCKWARSTVQLRLRAGETLHITVQDDGPGIPDTAREFLMVRGSRLDEQVDGHGLGLAIVKDLVNDYRGELEFSVAALGGLRVDISLPLTGHP